MIWPWKRHRVRTPTVIQMEAVECGAASLSIILSYFGKFVPLEELRVKCGVTRDGSRASNIIKAAELYGVESGGYKVELEDIAHVPPPFIVFWEFSHYLVVEGFGKNRVYLNDPASGPRAISYEEFDDGYTGIVITFEPKEKFKKSEKPPKLIANLKERLKSVKMPLLFIFLCGLGLLFPGWAVPAVTQIFFDNILGQELLSWGWGVTSSILCLSALSGGLTWLQAAFLNRLNARLSVRFYGDFVWYLLRLPMSFYAQRFSGEVAYRATLNETVTQNLTGNLASTAISVILIIFYIGFMLEYNPLIACIGIFSALLNLLMLYLITRSRRDAYARKQQEMGKSIGFAIGALQNIETIKAAGNEHDFFSRWAGYYAKKLNADREINSKDVWLTTFPFLLQGFSTAALLGIGVWSILHGRLTVGMLMALQGLLTNFLTPVSQLVTLGSILQTLKIDIDRLDDVLKNKTDPALVHTQFKEGEAPKLQGFLELKEVTFGYSPIDPPLIEKLSLALSPGQRLALVGPTGCGKSTIANLISGLYQPWSGQILYDGKKRSAISRPVLTNSIASVDQKIFLFAGTIKENLTLWDPTISDEEIIHAAQDACIHEEILERQNGYHAEVSEGGSNFSGGQRQKLEIARSLILSPRLLIMDEATSALDSKTELLISQNLRRRGCSCVMIAHRLSTIRDCDEILVLDEGKVVQRGSHESLKAEKGLYQELVAGEQFTS
jgi:ATP-binding cassette, subfamily C, bacterial